MLDFRTLFHGRTVLALATLVAVLDGVSAFLFYLIDYLFEGARVSTFYLLY